VMVVSGSFSPARLSHGAADRGTTLSNKTNNTPDDNRTLLMIGTSLDRVRFWGRIISTAMVGLHGFQRLVTYSPAHQRHTKNFEIGRKPISNPKSEISNWTD
jgi:hypothetical protein